MKLLSLSCATLSGSTVALLLACTPLRAQQSAPDNSAQNASQHRTADDQPNAKADRATLAQVRRAIVADKTLSLYGHNVKVLVVAGKVTLKGPVHSEEEKQKVIADAGSVVDPGQITDRLTVSP